MTKNALITGITGQDGFYLTEHLLNLNYRVYGLVKNLNSTSVQEFMKTLPEVNLFQGDISSIPNIISVLELTTPSEIYNLAANSFVGDSWSMVEENAQTNALGALRILEGIRIFTSGQMNAIRYYQASSSEIFGQAFEATQNENTCLRPTSPYGVAKAYAHNITINFRESYDAYAVSGILFNHESPRRPPKFVSRKITQGVARIAKGDTAPIKLGDLDSRRDWGHAADYVVAMQRMLCLPKPRDFVIGTGVTHSVREFLTIAFDFVGISDWSQFVIHDPTQLRPTEVGPLVADNSLAKEFLAWSPKYDFESLIHEMVKNDLRY